MELGKNVALAGTSRPGYSYPQQGYSFDPFIFAVFNFQMQLNRPRSLALYKGKRIHTSCRTFFVYAVQRQSLVEQPSLGLQHLDSFVAQASDLVAPAVLPPVRQPKRKPGSRDQTALRASDQDAGKEHQQAAQPDL